MGFENASEEIRSERRSVGFDSYDITVKQLIDMVREGQVNISPDYQRRFVWDDHRQSQLIESIFLGIPIPSLFMATNEDATWEVIDGLQRLSTIMRFVAPRGHGTDSGPLKLRGMEKTPSLNGAIFDALPPSLQLNFFTRPIRVTVLNDRSDHQVRFDLFERLNTGGISLHEQEIRNVVFQGAFNEFIKNCALDERLNGLIRRSDKTGRGNVEELTLKFFAYFEDRASFRHSVKDFLNHYMEKKTDSFTNKDQLSFVFESTVATLSASLPNGIVRTARPNATPLILFEAMMVGTADVMVLEKQVAPARARALLDDPILKGLTTGATNSLPKLLDRISYVAENIVQ